MENRILIQGGYVYSADPSLGELEAGDVLIEGGIIKDVGENLPSDGAHVIDARDGIVLPGFVDCHSHLWEWSLRNIGIDWPVRAYMQIIRGRLGANYEPEDIYAGVRLGALEMLDVGVTTVIDCSHNMNTPEHADAAVGALLDSGIRAVLAYGSGTADWDPESAWRSTRPSNPLSDDARRVRSQYFPTNDGLVTMALCSRGSRAEHADEAWFSDLRLAIDLDVPITFAAGLKSRKRDVSEMVALQRAGLTDARVTCYHGDEMDDEELRILADMGGAIAYTPEAEMRGGLAVMNARRLLDFGVHPALGIDHPMKTSDYFGAMRQMMFAQGARQRFDVLRTGEVIQEVQIPTRTVLDVATIHGAHASWNAHRTGSLTPGKRADVIMLDRSALTRMPVRNPLGAVLMNASARNVNTVIVDGEIRKRMGKLVGFDEEAIVRQAVESRARVFEKAGYPVDAGELTA